MNIRGTGLIFTEPARMSTGVTYMFCLGISLCLFIYMACLLPKEGMERWGSKREEEGKKPRQSGIIVSDRAAP